MLKAEQKPAETRSTAVQLPRLLVIDDDEAIRKLLRFRLKDCYEVIDTGSPEDALALALQERPDAILLDLTMPGYSGFEVCQTLASLSFTEKIPIVIVTGQSGDRYKEFCEYIGAKAFFQKPLDIDALKSALTRLIDGKNRDKRVERRVHLRLAVTLRGTDSNGTAFKVEATTENVSANDFLAPCSVPLKEGAVVEVSLSRNAGKIVGSARVTKTEWAGTPGQRCDFHFTETPSEWILQ